MSGRDGTPTTIGEQVINRINDLETMMQALQARPTDTMFDNLSQQIRSIQNQLGDLGTSIPAGSSTRHQRSLYNSKEFLPDKLGNGFRDSWRSWAYKARDWLGQYDATLPSKLLAIESKRRN